MSEFCRVASEMIRLSIEADAQFLSKAMGEKISAADLRGRARPSSIHPDAVAADGTKAQFGFAIWRDPAWRQYYYLNWDKVGLSVSALIKFKDDNSVTKVLSALRNHGFGDRVQEKGNIVGIVRRLEPDDLADLPVHMHELLLEWCKFWESVGGIANCVRPSTRTQAAR
jgi:hypothetical protein